MTLPPVSVPLNVPRRTGREEEFLGAAVASGQISGNGPLTQWCNEALARLTGAPACLTTASGTAALEMAGLLAGLEPGDEVIMPSFTFVSTATVIALRNAVPVFVDIRPDTLNIDEGRIEAAITPRTKAVMVVHYAGVGCEMDAISEICRRRGLMLLEDAAQCVGARYRGKPLGTFGAMGAFSFHQTKNITCGEGGALLINDPSLIGPAEVVWEKGTNRLEFLRGRARNYEWQALSGAFLPSELTCAYLRPQLETAAEATRRRLELWNRYHALLDGIERHHVRRPAVPAHCGHNGHIYFVVMPDAQAREAALGHLRQDGIVGASHYLPLHTTVAGRRYGRQAGECAVSEDMAARLLRLPLYDSLGAAQQEAVASSLFRFAAGP